MGQYYVVVNLTKREFLEPYSFGDLAKLREFGTSRSGMLFGLAILLANSNGRGSGDADNIPENSTVLPGRWAGDTIVIAGDYAGPGDPGEPPYGGNLYTLCAEGKGFKDVSVETHNLVRANL